jgi:hypothetical protein
MCFAAVLFRTVSVWTGGFYKMALFLSTDATIVAETMDYYKEFVPKLLKYEQKVVQFSYGISVAKVFVPSVPGKLRPLTPTSIVASVDLQRCIPLQRHGGRVQVHSPCL